MSHVCKKLAILLLAGGALLLVGCEEEEQAPTSSGPRALPVTVITSRLESVAVIERTLGSLVSKQAPTLSAEVAARVVEVLIDEGERVARGQLLLRLDDGDFQLERQRAEAELQRLDALIENQQRRLQRNRTLLTQNLISQSDVDESNAELRALQAQLTATRVQLAQAERNRARTEIRSPVAGEVERRLVDAGDWAGQGEPLIQLSSDEILRAQLPFAEALADQLRPGLPIWLHSPAAPAAGQSDLCHTLPTPCLAVTLTELRPTVGGGRAVLALAEFPNPGGWRPGASVDAAVELYRYEEALLLPAVSVVPRPTGSVIFLRRDDKAEQRVVRTGRRFGEQMQILEGLEPGEQVIVDGAGFLTDGALIQVESAP